MQQLREKIILHRFWFPGRNYTAQHAADRKRQLTPRILEFFNTSLV